MGRTPLHSMVSPVWNGIPDATKQRREKRPGVKTEITATGTGGCIHRFSVTEQTQHWDKQQGTKQTKEHKNMQ